MLNQETRVIEGLEFKCQQFPARRAFALLTRLGKVLGPVLGAAKGISLDTDITKLAPMLAQLDSEEAVKLASDLLASTTAIKDGKQIQLLSNEMQDLVFGSNLVAYLGAVGFAIEVNFASFFRGVGAMPGEKSAAKS